MPPPPPLFIPPVTGTGGVPGAVEANWYDDTGNFCGRSASVKRRRNLNDTMEAAFDMTKDFPPLSYPAKPKVTMGSVKALLVEAAKRVA
jgi:hypothetical protein